MAKPHNMTTIYDIQTLFLRKSYLQLADINNKKLGTPNVRTLDNVITDANFSNTDILKSKRLHTKPVKAAKH